MENWFERLPWDVLIVLREPSVHRGLAARVGVPHRWNASTSSSTVAAPCRPSDVAYSLHVSDDVRSGREQISSVDQDRGRPGEAERCRVGDETLGDGRRRTDSVDRLG